MQKKSDKSQQGCGSKDVWLIGITICLIAISIANKYDFGYLVGFIILILIVAYERIKRIIFDLNITKIFGIEMSERKRKELVSAISEAADEYNIDMKEEEAGILADVAMNKISGVENKGRYYEEMVYWALKDLGLSFQRNLEFRVGRDAGRLDFVVNLKSGYVLPIEVIYYSRAYLSENHIKRVINLFNISKKVDRLSRLLVITNSDVKENDKESLSRNDIDIISNTVTPDYVLSKLKEYITTLTPPDTPSESPGS